MSLTPFVVRLTHSCQLRVLSVVCLLVLVVAAPQLSAQSAPDLASGVHSAVALPSSSITPDAPPFGGANVVVTSAGGPQNETTIAIDPNNPSNLIGGANDDRNGDAQCGRYTSSNKGRSWTDLATLGLFTPSGSTRACTAAGDPGVAFDANGHAYYLCMYFTRTPGNDQTQYVHKSNDGGATWGPPIQVSSAAAQTNFDDKGHIAVDPFPRFLLRISNG